MIYKYKKEFSNGHLNINQTDVDYFEIPEDEPLKIECQHFIDVVEKNIKPLTDGVEGLNVIKILSAASLSQNKKQDEAMSHMMFSINRYEDLISLLLDAKLVPTTNWIKKQNINSLLLRHDVDFSVDYAYQLAHIESKLKVNSTFFMLTSNMYNCFLLIIKSYERYSKNGS